MTEDRPGRNDLCHCGSGRKYKHCCLDKDEAATRAASTEAEEAPAAAPAKNPAEAAPKHQTYQPWKKSEANTRGFHRVSTPRKVGGG